MKAYFTLNSVFWLLTIISCNSYEYKGKKFQNEYLMNEYIEREKQNEVMKNKEAQNYRYDENSYDYFTERYDPNLILDLRDKENRITLSIAYFNQYENTKSLNKFIIENQFEYNRDKIKYEKIKKSKYLFFEPDKIYISAYDFQKSFFYITWIDIDLPFPRFALSSKSWDSYRGIVNGSWEIGGQYEINNKPKLFIEANEAESLLKRFKNVNIRLLLEVIKAKDINPGIDCYNLKNTLFNGDGNESEINFYIRPTCVSEKWNKITIRNIETKIVGYYIVDGDNVYKWIEKK